MRGERDTVSIVHGSVKFDFWAFPHLLVISIRFLAYFAPLLTSSETYPLGNYICSSFLSMHLFRRKKSPQTDVFGERDLEDS